LPAGRWRFPAAAGRWASSIGGIEIILNLEADRTEHMIGHRIMNRAHAFLEFRVLFVGDYQRDDRARPA